MLTTDGVKKKEDEPLQLQIKERKKFGDFVWTCYSDLLFTNETIEIFEKNNVTGYKLQDIIMEELPKNIELKQVVVLEPKARLDIKSGYKEYDVCPYCGHYQHTGVLNGMIIDESSWNGNDIFKIEEFPWFIFATEKVKRIIEENKMKGIKVVDSLEERIKPRKPIDPEKLKLFRESHRKN